MVTVNFSSARHCRRDRRCRLRQSLTGRRSSKVSPTDLPLSLPRSRIGWRARAGRYN